MNILVLPALDGCGADRDIEAAIRSMGATPVGPRAPAPYAGVVLAAGAESGPYLTAGYHWGRGTPVILYGGEWGDLLLFVG